MKRFIALALAATFAFPSFALLSGCNTVEGAGKDVEAGGEGQGRGPRAQEVLNERTSPNGVWSRSIWLQTPFSHDKSVEPKAEPGPRAAPPRRRHGARDPGGARRVRRGQDRVALPHSRRRRHPRKLLAAADGDRARADAHSPSARRGDRPAVAERRRRRRRPLAARRRQRRLAHLPDAARKIRLAAHRSAQKPAGP